MKKFIIALFAMVLTVGAFAQDHNGRGQRREFNPDSMAIRHANRMKESLSLTDDQYAKVKEYFLTEAKAQKERMEQMKNNQGGQKMDRETMEAERKTRQEAQAKALKEILTEEQYTKYEEQEKNRRQRGGGRGPQGGPQGGQNQ